ncbi:MAG: serine/threonine-protein phosphatase [Roseburia sp.]|nr:serine/threonine-protein phosphatase [Roseburia sp.]MCM1096830.1 serine/threonine-protein phosphatase [Ruminococcus flavefaciens]
MIGEVTYFSERGVREVNQDAIYASAKGDRGIFVVADGMGGHFGGEIASGAIVNGVKKWWSSNDFGMEKAGIDSIVEQCGILLTNINREVYSLFCQKGQVGGSTVAVLILCDDRYEILSAGDSRIYRARGKTLKQLTTDDVWENLPEVKYAMSDEQMKNDMRFGKLTEALGSAERLKVRREGGILMGKDVFLLCSDGVYRYCSREELEKILCGGAVFRSMARKKEMIRKCVLRGGMDDNYSAILCSV